jgi:hypothetical protein
VAHGASVAGDSWLVRDVCARTCPDSCPSLLPLGIGIGLYQDASLTVDGVIAEDFALCGP